MYQLVFAFANQVRQPPHQVWMVAAAIGIQWNKLDVFVESRQIPWMGDHRYAGAGIVYLPARQISDMFFQTAVFAAGYQVADGLYHTTTRPMSLRRVCLFIDCQARYSAVCNIDTAPDEPRIMHGSGMALLSPWGVTEFLCKYDG